MQDATAPSPVPQATESFPFPAVPPAIADPLTDVLRRGARRMLIQAVEAEVAAWIDRRAALRDEIHRCVFASSRAPLVTEPLCPL